MVLVKNSRVIQIVLVLAVAAMMSACGMDHSPVASSDDAARIDPDPVSAPAAKKVKDTTDSTTDDGSKVTSKTGPARFSMGGKGK